MKFRVSLGVSLLLVGMLAACDRSSPYDKGPANEGNVSVMANEGRLVGRGRMEVDGHEVAVKMSRVTVDGKDYGAVTEGSEVYYRSNGDFHQLLVNGEERHPTKKK
jgi:hypothetical protein